MNTETTRKLKALEHLLIKRRVIDQEIEVLKESLIPEIPKDAKIQTESGTFTVESRPKWVYSPQLTVRKNALDADKKTEEADGTAKRVPGDPFIVYRENKD